MSLAKRAAMAYVAGFVAAAGALLVCPPAASQEEGWNEPMVLYPKTQQQMQVNLRVYEVHGSLGAQEGVVVPGGGRSPVSLRLLFGVNLFRFNISALGGRVLTGPFVTFPFSIEVGWAQDIQQYGPGIGWQFSGRPTKSWKWTFGVCASWVTPGAAMMGPGVSLGAVYYILSGFGLFGEVNLEAYFGKVSVLTVGGTVGLILSHEVYKKKRAE